MPPALWRSVGLPSLVQGGAGGWEHVADELLHGASVGMGRPGAGFEVDLADLVPVGPVLVGEELEEAVQVSQLGGEDAGDRVDLVAAGAAPR